MAQQADRFWTVGELARELGVTPRTIRFYEDRGLILPGRAGTTRVYAPRDRARLILILRGKQLGFSLREIRDYLDLYDADPAHAGQIRLLLDKVRDRIARLDEQRTALDETLAELRKIEAQAVAALTTRTKTLIKAGAA
ncbi:MAG: MerR family DNA-binding transcriptional regulator [Acetobacteraceae bacterium]|nr:MerR family DNA-binding transcriptional regulator [Acetobacteraceae bacterium]